jgi:3D-(3,5/4)-trihydroxycyclohexane-1,2-dione acylhydrolase (decyclizing)
MVIETDPNSASDVGGAWWDVAIPEVSSSESVNHARSEYEQNIRKPRRGES